MRREKMTIEAFEVEANKMIQFVKDNYDKILDIQFNAEFGSERLSGPPINLRKVEIISVV